MISIDEAISVSQRRAKRLWVVSIIWVAVMAGIAFVFGVSIYQFNETRSQIDELKATATKLIADLQQTKNELSLLKRTGSVQSRHLYALSLQMRPPDKLTSEQKEFIKRQVEETSKEGSAPEALTVQAYSELIDKKLQDAYDDYSYAMTLQVDFAPAYAGRSLVDSALGDFTKASADLTQALALDKDPTHRPILLAWRAEALAKLGKIADAEQDLAEADKSSDPEIRSMVLNDRGFVQLKKKNWDEAEAAFREAAKLQPEQARGRLENIGLVYLWQSEWTKAYDWSVKISELPDKSGGWVWMIEALAAEKLGKSAERKAALRQYITNINGANSEAASLNAFLPDELARLAQNWVVQGQK